MPSTKKTLVAAAGAVVLGAGLGVAGLASADPTPSPTPSATTSGAPIPDQDRPGPGGRHGAPHDSDLAQELASKLGVTEAKVTEALQAIREANRPTGRPDPQDRPDPTAREAALARALAEKLGVDEAKVTAALAEIRATRQAERAAALKDRLYAAVTAGTLTQAEADAVQKAVEKGVIDAGGPGRR
jgi:ABC-type amino acid transport substrate-binding protein